MFLNTTSHQRSRKSRAFARGFTLTELLVALVAGMMVAAAAFSFSKQSTRFFAQEARVAAAQMSVLSGFERLQNDISRAAMMSTANMRRDVDPNVRRVCAPADIYSDWPAALQNLVGFNVAVGGSTVDAYTMPDGKFPDLIRISGSLSSVERFPVDAVEQDGGDGHSVYLQIHTGAFTRAGFVEGGDLSSVFRAGRILRILDQKGNEEYAVIASSEYPIGSKPVIKTVKPLPVLETLTEGTETQAECGIAGTGMGNEANVVNIVEYGIGNLRNNPIYAKTVYSDAGTALGDEGRTELIRRELFLDGDDPVAMNLDPNAEIVAEYAVDLRVGLWVGAPGGAAFLEPSSDAVTERMVLEGSYSAIAAPTGPESIRAVQLRLVVRSREVDRRVDMDPTDPMLDGGFIYRYALPNGAGFARARTLLADVALRNQRRDAWQQ